MKHVDHSSGDKEGEVTEQVVLTGFEPFGRVKINQSWHSIKPLAECPILPLPPSTPKSYSECSQPRISIQVYELPVVYSQIPNLVRNLHRTVNVPRRHFIHVGAGKTGSICLESLANQSGYKQPDNLGEHPADGEVTEYVGKCPGILNVRVDVHALCSWLHSRGWQHVSVSKDAGRYLCEYTLYCSLAECYLAREGNKEKNDDEHQQETNTESEHVAGEKSHTKPNHHSQEQNLREHKSRNKVAMFVHLPPVNEPYTLLEMTAILRDIAEWVAAHY
ncbi:uncharacterized protein VTP21DRAFT_10642 [Calcarisporiella thermophila]|uniref:uncharacterized protein n=1 Tax=Calcarisporiella thermophila TaxID=911321 RepID=UPI003742BC3A